MTSRSSDPLLPPTSAGAPLTASRQRGAVTWRSLLVGTIGVVLISVLTPYNNYVLGNTGLIGSYLPVGLVLYFLVFVLAINGPLNRWMPKHALGGGELSVALAMVLVGCSLPSGGFFRYLPGHLVAFFYHASTSPEYADLLRWMHLKDWLFPAFPMSDPAARGNDPIVQFFFTRVPVDGDGFAERWTAIPWGAWIQPAISWGIFAAALLGFVICLSTLFRRQWVENERLPFPLASIYLALVEPPAPRRFLNGLFSARAFWVTFAAVFFIHSLNALNAYDTEHWPLVPLSFDLRSLATEAPLRYLSITVLVQRISLTIVGVTYFVQSQIAFSIWMFFLLGQFAGAMMSSQGNTLTEPMQMDQIFGALIPFAATILWVARGHLLAVARQMFGRRRPDDPIGRYLPYSFAGWGLIACLATLVVWLVLAGASLVGAIVLVLMVATIYLVLAKIVAETGLLYVLIPVPLTRPWIYALSGMGTRTTMPSYFFASMFSGTLTRDLREASPVYVTHALRVTDSSVGTRGGGVGVVLALVLALVVGFFVAGASSLYVHYSYASSLDQQQQTPLDAWGTRDMPQILALDSAIAYQPQRGVPIESHSRLGHFTFGFGLTALLSFLRLRFAAWPLHPVGYLLGYTWSVQLIWFSVFLGWLAKAMVTRFGGSSLYQSARPVFLGLIFGEMSAAGFWLVITAMRAEMGLSFEAIRLLPY